MDKPRKKPLRVNTTGVLPEHVEAVTAAVQATTSYAQLPISEAFTTITGTAYWISFGPERLLVLCWPDRTTADVYHEDDLPKPPDDLPDTL